MRKIKEFLGYKDLCRSRPPSFQPVSEFPLLHPLRQVILFCVNSPQGSLPPETAQSRFGYSNYLESSNY